MAKTRYFVEVGQKFDRLTVLEDRLNGFAFCICECGTVRDFRKIDLRRSVTRSCGCWSADRVRKHGMEGTPTYRAWSAMLQRCRNPKNKFYSQYGGRGIAVCKRWEDFRNFFADMGEKSAGHSIDRINNDGDYKPSNCRWATHKEQMRNRRVTLRTMYEGKMTAISEIAEIHSVDRVRLAARIRRGVPLARALNNKKLSRWKKD